MSVMRNPDEMAMYETFPMTGNARMAACFVVGLQKVATEKVRRVSKTVVMPDGDDDGAVAATAVGTVVEAAEEEEHDDKACCCPPCCCCASHAASAVDLLAVRVLEIFLKWSGAAALLLLLLLLWLLHLALLVAEDVA